MVGDSGYRTRVDLALSGAAAGSVDVTTGNLLLTFCDLRLRDLDTPISVGRTYNSCMQASQDLGPGWRLNTGFELELGLDDPDRPVFTGPTGAVERFLRQEDGTYTADGAFDAQLHRSESGYKLQLGSTGDLGYDVVHELDEQGRVRRVSDPFGDRVGDGLSATVFDTALVAGVERLVGQSAEREGRRTTIFRDHQARVVRITTSDGGALEYGYEAGRLVVRSANGLPPRSWGETGGALAPQTFTYGADGRLSSVTDAGRALLDVTYDEQGRVSRTTATDDDGVQVMTFEYGPGSTVVRGSDSSHRVFDAAIGGVVPEDRQGPDPPRVVIGGTLPRRLPEPVDPDTSYHLAIDAKAHGDPVARIEVFVDGARIDDAIMDRAGPGGDLSGTVEFMGDTFGVATTLVLEIVATTETNSVTTRRLVVRVPWSEPEPFPDNVRGARRATKGRSRS